MSSLRPVRVLALLLLAECGASPPPGRDLRGQEWKSTGAFASLARCTSGIPPCPGSSCAENAVGAADGKTVDLRACATLDLVFTGGTILSRGGGADLAFYLATLAGLTHVEASRDGQSYVMIGFIGREPDLPPGTSEGCASALETPTKVTLSLGDCNSISEARFLRLSRDSGNAGALVVDAVEALSFKPAGS